MSSLLFVAWIVATVSADTPLHSTCAPCGNTCHGCYKDLLVGWSLYDSRCNLDNWYEFDPSYSTLDECSAACHDEEGCYYYTYFYNRNQCRLHLETAGIALLTCDLQESSGASWLAQSTVYQIEVGYYQIFTGTWPNCANVGSCISGTTLEGMENSCNLKPECFGFTFSESAKGGCLKRDDGYCKSKGFGSGTYDFYIRGNAAVAASTGYDKVWQGMSPKCDNRVCFLAGSKVTLEDMRYWCNFINLHDEIKCIGFSFSETEGTGCLKADEGKCKSNNGFDVDANIDYYARISDVEIVDVGHVTVPGGKDGDVPMEDLFMIFLFFIIAILCLGIGVFVGTKLNHKNKQKLIVNEPKVEYVDVI